MWRITVHGNPGAIYGWEKRSWVPEKEMGRRVKSQYSVQKVVFVHELLRVYPPQVNIRYGYRPAS
jgi:hypothetical protein